MRRQLQIHPDSHNPAVTTVEAEARRSSPGSLAFHFVVTGRLAELRIPPPQTPSRADGLWRRTCLEAFIQGAGREAYFELNLSPSTQWAAYRFDGYRRGTAPASVVAAPSLALRSTPERLELDAAFAFTGGADLPDAEPWRLGLSAVIEAVDGSLSYWALAHPPGRPDFHHPDCFAAELAATDAA